MAKYEKTSTEVYDYIICGGGTAGCAVAGRLAEDPGIRVLIIEAGESNENLENTKILAWWNKSFGSSQDFNIVDEENDLLGGKRIILSRGKFLGGCSNINGTLCIRGMKQDYDDWNIEGWSGEEMFRYMAKAENFHDKEWFHSANDSHGYSGPLNTEPHDVAPISKLVREAMIEKGLTWNEDMFTSGVTPHGSGYAVRTVHKGIRVASTDYLAAGLKTGNIVTRINTTVEKIIMEKIDDGMKVSGVQVVNADGTTGILKATRETIISGGAYSTPTILLRSGIGPKADLENLAITCNIDLPGVGKNLMDHINSFVFYETKVPDLTTDRFRNWRGSEKTSYEEWKQSKTGEHAKFPFGAFAFARLDRQLKDHQLWNTAARPKNRDPMGHTSMQPTVELYNAECMLRLDPAEDPALDGKHIFGISTMLLGQQSRGTVTLKSTDPNDKPSVDCRFLQNPLDHLVLAEGMKLANEIVMESEALKGFVCGSWPPESGHHTWKSTEQWKTYVQQGPWACYHPAGTCKMGQEEDSMAVLDERLRVRGVEGLRVADASVMPCLNNGHTQIAVYAIAEKAADLIKEDREKLLS